MLKGKERAAAAPMHACRRSAAGAARLFHLRDTSSAQGGVKVEAYDTFSQVRRACMPACMQGPMSSCAGRAATTHDPTTLPPGAWGLAA